MAELGGNVLSCHIVLSAAREVGCDSASDPRRAAKGLQTSGEGGRVGGGEAGDDEA